MTNTRKRYIHFAIMFLITVAICNCPPVGQITEYGMKVLAVFIAVLYGWIFIDLIWPSLFGFVVLGITGVMPAVGALAAGFGNMQFLMIFVTMVFAGALDQIGVTDFLSSWLLKRKVFRASPWRFIIGLVLIGYLVGTTGNTIAAVFLLWGIVIRTADLCGMNKKDPLISFCIMMITVASFNGSLVFPFIGGALIYHGFFVQAIGTPIPAIPFIVFVTIVTMAISILLFLIGKFVIKLDTSKFMLPSEVVSELDAKVATKKEKIGFAILVIYFVALLLPNILSGFPGMGLLSSNLGVVGMGILALLLMNFVSIDGEPVMDLAKTFSQHVNWPLLLLMAVTFPLADCMKSQDAGIMPTISEAVVPAVSGMGPIAFMIVSMILLGIVTQFTHNIVLGAMFIPFLCPLCESLGGNQAVMFFMIYLVLNAAYVTPAGSMQSAMVHGHEYMDKKYAYLYGILVLVATCFVLAAIGIPLGDVLL